MTERTQVSTARRWRMILKTIVHWTFRLVVWSFAVIGLVTVVYFTGFEYSRVLSESMSPTLEGKNSGEGDRVLSEKFAFWFRRPRR